jgi:acetylglutamate kinase
MSISALWFDNPVSFTMNRPLVVKLGGAILDKPSALSALMEQLAKLQANHREGLILVHGGGCEVDRFLAARGWQSEKYQGLRKTPDEHLDYVVAVLAGLVNKRLLGLSRKAGLSATGLCLADGGMVDTAITSATAPLGRVGAATPADPELAITLLNNGYMLIISSIGIDTQGQCLNINADQAAAAVAQLVQASRLILLTDQPGVLDRQGQLLNHLLLLAGSSPSVY